MPAPPPGTSIQERVTQLENIVWPVFDRDEAIKKKNENDQEHPPHPVHPPHPGEQVNQVNVNE